MRRSVQLGASPSVSFDAGVDVGHTWKLQISIDNDKVLDKLIDGAKLPTDATSRRAWEHVNLDLSNYRNRNVVIRLYDLVLVPGHEAGNSYWKNLQVR